MPIHYDSSSRRTFLTRAASAALTLTSCATPRLPDQDLKTHPDEPVLLPPRVLPWPLRDWKEAQTSLSYEDDGRMRLSIVHQVLRGVTPTMLVWWFNNIEGSMEVNGRSLPRYHVWHPIDHIDFWCTNRDPMGRVGPGSVFHIIEAFNGNLDFIVNAESVVEKLDETGLIHGPRKAGMKVAHMEYEFVPTEEGTLYRNFMLVGPDGWLLKQPVNLVREWLFSEQMGRAWLRHNVEEVGLLEHFLPRLYRERQR